MHDDVSVGIVRDAIFIRHDGTKSGRQLAPIYDDTQTTFDMDKIRINYSKFDLKNNGKGVIAVLMYSGSGDPKIALDNAVLKLTDGIGYFELIDAHLDNPWTRVIITGINDMIQEDLDPIKHKLKALKNG